MRFPIQRNNLNHALMQGWCKTRESPSIKQNGSQREHPCKGLALRILNWFDYKMTFVWLTFLNHAHKPIPASIQWRVYKLENTSLFWSHSWWFKKTSFHKLVNKILLAGHRMEAWISFISMVIHSNVKNTERWILLTLGFSTLMCP